MNSIHFTKMNGQGNDYILVNCLEKTLDDPQKHAIAISDRHFGVGSDGLILIQKGKRSPFEMVMYNADGSYSAMCGNGLRCVARYLYDSKLTKERFSIETGGRLVEAKHFTGGIVEIDMGIPKCIAREVFLTIKSQEFRCCLVSMGNPHCVISLDTKNQLDNFPLQEYGPLIERHQMFPDRTNVEFIVDDSKDKSTLYQRTWERGTGETLACGSGACAALVATILVNSRELSPENAPKQDVKESRRVVLLGGEVFVDWDRASEHIFLTGKADYNCEGTWTPYERN